MEFVVVAREFYKPRQIVGGYCVNNFSDSANCYLVKSIHVFSPLRSS
jgi:hypothetical protein